MTCSELTREHDVRKVREFPSLWPFLSSVSVHSQNGSDIPRLNRMFCLSLVVCVRNNSPMHPQHACCKSTYNRARLWFPHGLNSHLLSLGPP